MGARNIGWDKTPNLSSELPFLHPGASCVVTLNEKVVGYVGEVHPKVAANFGLGEDIPVMFELDLEHIFNALAEQKTMINANTAKFPAVTRDLALAMKATTTYRQFDAAVSKFPKRRNLQDFRIFDIYLGKGLAEDEKSLATTFTFQSAEKTLTDKEVEKEFNLLTEWLCQQLEATQR